MNGFEEFLRHDMRLVLLRVLAQMPAYRSNSSILAGMLDRFGHAVTRDQVKTEMGWLAEQGLVQVVDAGDVSVGTLTERGQDVAAGRAVVHGVTRPAA